MVYDSRLILRKGSNTLGIINELLQETGAKTVVWTALYEPWLESRDQEIRTKLEKRGVEVHVEHSYLLHRPGMAINSFFLFAFVKQSLIGLRDNRG